MLKLQNRYHYLSAVFFVQYKIHNQVYYQTNIERSHNDLLLISYYREMVFIIETQTAYVLHKSVGVNYINYLNPKITTALPLYCFHKSYKIFSINTCVNISDILAIF